MKMLNIRQFFNQFPDDETCLEHLFNVRFGQGHVCPKCERNAKWYRINAEQAFSCQWCGHHIHPMVGTIFQKSRTPLQLWFYAIFLFTTSKHGVSAKELQRQLGVTYKTAWRMAALIRDHMAAIDGDIPIGGPDKIVEVDETFYGGEHKSAERFDKKAVVMGMMERNGDVVLEVVPNRRGTSLRPQIRKHISKGSEVHTDQHVGYKFFAPKEDYTHKTVNHSIGEYALPDGTSANSIEGFFNHLKKSLAGTHTTVSKKHLRRYVKEFEYRFNRRMRPETMLSELLSRFPEMGA